MKYQKIVSLLDNETTQPSKYKTKKLVEINDEVREMYSTNREIKFKTKMLKSSLCDSVISTYMLKGI